MHPIDHTPPDLRTLTDIVRYCASRFNEAGLVYGHGTDNAIDEAAALALHALHLPPDLPDPWWGAALIPAERDAVMARARRRIEERLPLPYITHEAWFAGLSFYVDPRVLIPRSPLAEFIDRGFAPWWAPEDVGRILEIGTGSGCIGIACAYACPQAEVAVTDNDADALEVASINVRRHGVEDHVTLVEADVYPTDDPGPWDVIITNPPYVDTAAMQALPPEYRHEPRRALAAGEDGLDVVRRILAGARERLTPQGVLVLEVGDSMWALEDAFPDLPWTWLDFEHGGHGVAVITRDDLRVP